VLGLSSCSNWLLGQEGEVPGCFVSSTGFLPVGCFGGTVVAAATEGTASGIDVDVDVDSSAGASVPEGDSV
jgi:predicted lipoprotein